MLSVENNWHVGIYYGIFVTDPIKTSNI